MAWLELSQPGQGVLILRSNNTQLNNLLSSRIYFSQSVRGFGEKNFIFSLKEWDKYNFICI